MVDKSITVIATWILPLGIALISLAVSGWSSYSHNDKAVAQRISVVETQQTSDGKRLDRMEDKLDQILSEVYSNRESNQQKLDDLIKSLQVRPVPVYRVPARPVPPPLPPTLPVEPPALAK
jgi:hypothetical protein